MSENGKYVYEPGEDSFYRIRKPNGKIYLPHHLAQTLNSARLAKFRKFAYSHGNVLVIQHPQGMQEPTFADALQQFADLVYAKTSVNPVVIAVNKLSEVTVMDEERMEKYGWVKKDRVLMFKEERWDTQEDTEEE